MKYKSKHLIPIILVFIGLTAMSLTVASDLSLRLRLKEGSKNTLKVKSSMMTTMDVQGQKINSSQTLELCQTLLVKQASDATNIIETQVKSMKMSQSQMGSEFTYDSEHPEKTSPMLASHVKDIEKQLNKPFLVTIDNCGNVIEVSEENVLSNISSIVLPYPSDAVSVGTTWNDTIQKKEQGESFSTIMNYTVKEINKKSAVIDIAGSVDSSAEVKGTFVGTATVSKATGLVTSSSIKQNLSMRISEQGIDIPITISGITNTTLE